MGELSGFAGAWTTTRLITAAKWRTVRTPGARAWLWIGLFFGVAGLSAAAQAGDLIRLIAEVDGMGTTPGVVANTYISQWVQAGFGTFTSAILAFAIGTAVISPLMSSSAPTLMPSHHLVGFRTSAMHPYVSALAVHLTSLVTFIQLLAMTALAGLLTIDGVGRTRAVLLCWVGWVVAIVFAQAALWGSRVLRRVSSRATAVSVVAVIAAVAVGALLDPDAAAGLFGLSAAFSWWVLDAPVLVSVTLAVLAVAASGVTGWVWCAATVKANAVATPARGAARGTRPMPSRGLPALIALVARSFIRTRSIRTPLVTITALAGVAVMVLGDRPAVVLSVGVGIPVAVGLAWTDNAAAMTGSANSWLASLPRQGARLLGVWAAWAWLVTLTLVVAAWAPALVLGRVSWATTGSVLLTGVAAASTVTAAALWQAVHAPAPARTDLGDGMLTASRAASASLRLLVVPGMGAWLATSGSSALRAESAAAPLTTQALGAALCVALALVAGSVVGLRWMRPRTRALTLAGAA